MVMNISPVVDENNFQSDSGQDEAGAISLVIERAVLLKSLSHVQSVVEKRNTLQILSNVKLEAKSGTLLLTATDMDVLITETVNANVSLEGELTVPAHMFYEIVRKLPEGAEVKLEGDSGNTGRVKITSGSSEFSLPCIPAKDYPEIEQDDMSHRFSVSSAELQSLIDKTRFAISNEETRYYLNGIYFHTVEELEVPVLRTVATDGHRMASVDVDMPDGAEGMAGVIIPRKTVNEVRKLLEEVEGDVEISLSKTKISFVCGNAVLSSKLIDGTFPDYQKVIPEGNDRSMEVPVSLLAKAVDRVSTVTTEKSRSVFFKVEGGKLTLSASNNENSSASEEIEVVYDSEPVEVAFNCRYVLEMLAGLEGDVAEFLLGQGASPALVKDYADKSALYVIMPVRF